MYYVCVLCVPVEARDWCWVSSVTLHFIFETVSHGTSTYGFHLSRCPVSSRDFPVSTPYTLGGDYRHLLQLAFCRILMVEPGYSLTLPLNHLPSLWRHQADDFYLVLLRNQFLSQSDTWSAFPLLICPFILLVRRCIGTECGDPSLCFCPHPLILPFIRTLTPILLCCFNGERMPSSSYSFTAIPLQERSHICPLEFPVQASVSVSVGVWGFTLFFAFSTMGYIQSSPLSCL